MTQELLLIFSSHRVCLILCLEIKSVYFSMLLHYFTSTDMTLHYTRRNCYNLPFKEAYATPVSPTNAI